MGPFEAFYASPLQHPILLWIAAGLALVFCLLRTGIAARLRRYCLVLVALSLSDAWLTSSHVYGIGELPGGLASTLPLFFVLAGDYRYLLLIGIATPEGGLRLRARPAFAALGLTAVVPLLSQAVVALLGARAEPRFLFLVYEVSFLLLTTGILIWHPALKAAPWLVPVSRFVLLYYGLWATADVVILAAGSDAGFLLRVVPNVLYYGGLIAVIARAAPRAAA